MLMQVCAPARVCVCECVLIEKYSISITSVHSIYSIGNGIFVYISRAVHLQYLRKTTNSPRLWMFADETMQLGPIPPTFSLYFAICLPGNVFSRHESTRLCTQLKRSTTSNRLNWMPQQKIRHVRAKEMCAVDTCC